MPNSGIKSPNIERRDNALETENEFAELHHSTTVQTKSKKKQLTANNTAYGIGVQEEH